MNELLYFFATVKRYKHPKRIWRELVCHWYRVGNDEVAPREIYTAIANYDASLAQELINKQCEFWDCNDPALMRAQSYLDLL